MKRRWLTSAALLALAAAATLGLAACGGDDNQAADTSGGGGGSQDISAVLKQLGGPVTFGTVAKGGTFRIANTDFAQSDGFDPTGEYFGSDFTIYSNLLLRTLVSYQFTARRRRATSWSPDLATEIPKPSADGLTYTFTLKDGIKFGPPVNRRSPRRTRLRLPAHRHAERRRPVRLLLPADQGPATSSRAGKAKTITGIATPDDKTITFTLTKPVGDFLFRARDAGHRADPRGGGQVLHRGRRVRPLRHLVAART